MPKLTFDQALERISDGRTLKSDDVQRAAAVATFLADPARHVGARLGDFNVRDVSAQRITVGCHVFNMDTAERIRQQLREKGIMQ